MTDDIQPDAPHTVKTYAVDARMPFDRHAIEMAIVVHRDKWKTDTFALHQYSQTRERTRRLDQEEAFAAGVYAGIAMLTGIVFEPGSFPLEALGAAPVSVIDENEAR